MRDHSNHSFIIITKRYQYKMEDSIKKEHPIHDFEAHGTGIVSRTFLMSRYFHNAIDWSDITDAAQKNIIENLLAETQGSYMLKPSDMASLLDEYLPNDLRLTMDPKFFDDLAAHIRYMWKQRLLELRRIASNKESELVASLQKIRKRKRLVDDVLDDVVLEEPERLAKRARLEIENL